MTAIRAFGCSLSGIGVILFLMFVLLITDMAFGAHLLAGYYLLFGWVHFLQDAVAKVNVNWNQVATVVFCLLLMYFGLQRFLSWLHLESHRSAGGTALRPWPARWTLGIISLVMLMFVAGIATVGITHQTAWIATSPEPMIENRSRYYRYSFMLYEVLELAKTKHWNAEQARRNLAAVLPDLNFREELNLLILSGPHGEIGAAVAIPLNSKNPDYGSFRWMKAGDDHINDEPMSELPKILANFSNDAR